MKFTHEVPTTPTYRQWASSSDAVFGDKYEVDRVFCNSKWRTITFICKSFKLNVKYEDDKSYKAAFKPIDKILSGACVCYLTPEDKSRCSVELDVAGDANESPFFYEHDDYGFSRRR